MVAVYVICAVIAILVMAVVAALIGRYTAMEQAKKTPSAVLASSAPVEMNVSTVSTTGGTELTHAADEKI